jgi:hypothetical protein
VLRGSKVPVFQGSKVLGSKVLGSKVLLAALLFVSASGVRAHDLERTRVVLTFAEDGSFVLDIANDPNWLLLRLEGFSGGQVPPRISPGARDARLRELGAVLIERIVLWADGREIRPDSADYLPAEALFRLRGRMPIDARTLRWLYGAVGDPYPLIIRRADGRTHAEVIEGSNWSGTIDLSGQFKPTQLAGIDHIVLLIAFFLVVIGLRARNLVRSRDEAGASINGPA